MSLEQILHDANPKGRFARDPKWYFVSIFGKPSAEGTWGWRFEGHHLSLSFTVVEGHIASITPSFWGTNPGKVLDGPRKGLQVPTRHPPTSSPRPIARPSASSRLASPPPR